MKKSVLLIAIVVMALSSTSLFAQGKYGADSANCIKYLSFYKEYYKQKSYDEAIPNWREAFSRCPATANQNMLVDGTVLMRRLISKNAKNPVYKAKLVDSLMMIHDARIANYPKYAVVARNNKGLDLANYIQNDPERLYKEFKEIIDANKNKTKPTIFLFYFNSGVELYKEGTIDEEEIIGVYEDCIEKLASLDAPTEEDQKMVDDIKLNIEELFATNNIADCDKLIELYTPKFNAAPNDAELASKIVKLMSTAGDCTDNKLFLAAATSVYKNNPSHASAHTLYLLNSAAGNSTEAVKYLQEAIDREDSDAAQDAEYLYELAVYNYKCGNSLAAEHAARKVLPITNKADVKGKAYMLLGTIWGSIHCEGNDIAKRAPYWVAVDYFEKAKAVDSALASEANKRIAEYSKYYPLTADAFMYGVNNGEAYEVNCNGFKASTTVRTQN